MSRKKFLHFCRIKHFLTNFCSLYEDGLNRILFRIGQFLLGLNPTRVLKCATMATKSKEVAAPEFEQSLARLEEILTELESAQIPLASLVEKYAEAAGCLENCRARLEEAELKVRKLSEKGFEAADV